MAVLHAFGSTLVDHKEIIEKKAIGDLDRFIAALEKGEEGSISFRGGNVTSREVLAEAPVNHTPIGLGQPISVEILCIYTGNAPSKLFSKPDLMVSSAVKSSVTHEVAPRAINQLIPNIKDRTIHLPSALSEGSPIVYYSPALDASTTLCSFEMVANSFNQDITASISGLMKSAAGFPVFAPAGSLLIGGSVISQLVGNIGKKVFETKPFLRGDLDIRLDTAGMIPTRAKQYVIVNDSDLGEIDRLRLHYFTHDATGASKVMLVDKQTGEEYRGDAPYLIINIDGKKRTDLQSFTPRLASAAMIERFYGDDSSGDSMHLIDQAMTLYNDFAYFNKAEELKKKIHDMNKESEEFRKSNLLLGAYIENINNDIFKGHFGR